MGFAGRLADVEETLRNMKGSNGRIDVGTIRADKIDVASLQAQNVSVSGGIQAAHDISAGPHGYLRGYGFEVKEGGVGVVGVGGIGRDGDENYIDLRFGSTLRRLGIDRGNGTLTHNDFVLKPSWKPPTIP
jgi:hypothetical protein